MDILFIHDTLDSKNGDGIFNLNILSTLLKLKYQVENIDIKKTKIKNHQTFNYFDIILISHERLSYLLECISHKSVIYVHHNYVPNFHTNNIILKIYRLFLNYKYNINYTLFEKIYLNIFISEFDFRNFPFENKKYFQIGINENVNLNLQFFKIENSNIIIYKLIENPKWFPKNFSNIIFNLFLLFFSFINCIKLSKISGNTIPEHSYVIDSDLFYYGSKFKYIVFKKLKLNIISLYSNTTCNDKLISFDLNYFKLILIFLKYKNLQHYNIINKYNYIDTKTYTWEESISKFINENF